MQDVIQDIGRAMAAPDADIKFCNSLMLACAGKLRQHGQNQGTAGVGGAGAGAAGLGGPGGPGANRPPHMQMPGATAGGGAINPMQPSLAAPNVMAGSQSPTPDELRRIIAQSTR